MRTVGDGKFEYREDSLWGRFPEDWNYEEVTAVDVDSKDRVYVFTRNRNGVVVFDREGQHLDTWGENLFTNPHGLYINSDDAVYCIDVQGNAVHKFTTDGQLLMTIANDDSRAASAPSDVWRTSPPFNLPTWLAVSPEGDLYVTDGYGNSQIHKFTTDGQLMFSWGEPGDGPGQFQAPHSVCLDSEGNVYVADRQNCRIQIFSPHGEYIDEWRDLSWPCDMCFDAEENMYVAELGGVYMGVRKPDETMPPARITVRNRIGQILAEWTEVDRLGAGRSFAPHGIAMDSHGDLYVGQVSKSYTEGIAPANWSTLRKYVRVHG